jgi:elongation factor Tu
MRKLVNNLPQYLLILLALFFSSFVSTVAQNRRPAAQPRKPTVNVAVLGHDGHGKTTLTAAITKVLSKTGGATFVHYDDLASPSDISVQGVTLAAAKVEYETDKARYVHVDCRGHADCVKLLTAEGVTLDGVIVVVSAQDGPMPQTREQLVLAHKAGIESVVVYLNKVELATDAELLELVELELRELLKQIGFKEGNVSIIRGSALMALVGTNDKIGRDSILELLRAMDMNFAPTKSKSGRER